MADIAVMQAVLDAKTYNDFSKLAELVKEGNISVITDLEARDLIYKKMTGHKFGGSTKRKTESEALELAMLAYYYHGQGLPRWNDSETSKTKSAAKKVSEIMNCSDSKVRKAMEKFKDHSLIRHSFDAGVLSTEE